ncbi:MAG: hypothetical protein QXO65_03720 [Candidatus Aenigmatarchaeota archaeon]
MNYIIEIYKEKDFPNLNDNEIDKKIRQIITKTKKVLNLKDDNQLYVKFYNKNNFITIYE